MSADPVILSYASPVMSIDAPRDGDVRIILGPTPMSHIVREVVGMAMGLLVIAIIATIAAFAMESLVAAIVMLLSILVIPLAWAVYLIRTRHQSRTIEVRDECLRTMHVRGRGDMLTFPVWSITALRLEGRWSLIPPRRVTALRLHLRLDVSTTLLDEIDCPELYKVYEALNQALKLQDRPPDPREAHLAEFVATARRPYGNI